LVANDGDAITITRPGANKIVLPVEAVTRLEIRRRRGRKLLGAVIGLGAGAVIGGLVGRATEEDEDYSPTYHIEQDFLPTPDLSSVPTKAEFYAMIGGLVGAAAGAIAAPGEKWETVNHENLQISVGPFIGHHRAGVLLAVRF